MKVSEDRPLVKMYKKTEACRNEWVLGYEFHLIKDKYIPVKYKTPWNSKYSASGYSVRYIKREDVLSYN